MQNRFTVFQRGAVFYCEDQTTGQQKSLRTRDEAEARRIVQAKNDAVTLPQMNLVMAKTYLSAQNPKMITRTWADVLARFCERSNLAWKFCFQVAVMRRAAPTTQGHYLRPVFLWADEAQNFVTDFDAEYQAVARSAGGCTVFLTQNRESYKRVLGNDDAVDSLLGNVQAKFFCQNSGDTNEWAAKLLGERYIDITSTNVGRSGTEGQSSSSGISRSEQRRYFVEPSRFTTLKRGGVHHGFQVEAIVYNGGHRFPTGAPGREELLPYKLITFNQK